MRAPEGLGQFWTIQGLSPWPSLACVAGCVSCLCWNKSYLVITEENSCAQNLVESQDLVGVSCIHARACVICYFITCGTNWANFSHWQRSGTTREDTRKLLPLGLSVRWTHSGGLMSAGCKISCQEVFLGFSWKVSHRACECWTGQMFYESVHIAQSGKKLKEVL